MWLALGFNELPETACIMLKKKKFWLIGIIEHFIESKARLNFSSDQQFYNIIIIMTWHMVIGSPISSFYSEYSYNVNEPSLMVSMTKTSPTPSLVLVCLTEAVLGGRGGTCPGCQNFRALKFQLKNLKFIISSIFLKLK